MVYQSVQRLFCQPELKRVMDKAIRSSVSDAWLGWFINADHLGVWSIVRSMGRYAFVRISASQLVMPNNKRSQTPPH